MIYRLYLSENDARVLVLIWMGLPIIVVADLRRLRLKDFLWMHQNLRATMLPYLFLPFLVHVRPNFILTISQSLLETPSCPCGHLCFSNTPTRLHPPSAAGTIQLSDWFHNCRYILHELTYGCG